MLLLLGTLLLPLGLPLPLALSSLVPTPLDEPPAPQHLPQLLLPPGELLSPERDLVRCALELGEGLAGDLLLLVEVGDVRCQGVKL